MGAGEDGTGRWQRWHERRFTVLLIGLGALFVAAPLLALLGPADDPRLARVVLAVLFLVVFLAAALAAGRPTGPSRAVAGLALVLFALQAADAGVGEEALLLPHHVLAVALLGYVSWRVLQHLFRARRVTGDTLAAAVCLYLLAGLAWSLVYAFVDSVQPGSFQASFADPSVPFRLTVRGQGSAEAFYFSFVTLTTLGYGDIVPVTAAGRGLAVAEALLGQLYLAILVARIVSLHIAHGLRPGGGE